MSDEPTTPESLDLLGDLADGFTSHLEGRLGRLARATGKFDASQVVTRGIQRLRLDLLDGAVLTDRGEEWIARWPWNNQAVDSCLWLLTDGMTAAPS